MFIHIALILLAAVLNGCHPMSESVTDQGAGLNGGFEHTKNELPVNWQLYTGKITGSGDFDLELDRTVFKEGKQSLKYTVRECSGQGGRFSPGMSQEVPARPGEHYRISFWVKNQGTVFNAKISAVNAFKAAEGPSLHEADNMEAWEQFSYDYKIPPEMQALRFEISILKPGTFWIDGISIDKLAASSEPQE